MFLSKNNYSKLVKFLKLILRAENEGGGGGGEIILDNGAISGFLKKKKKKMEQNLLTSITLI